MGDQLAEPERHVLARVRAPEGFAVQVDLQRTVQLAVPPAAPSEAGVTNTGDMALAGFDWTKPKPLPSSAGIRLRSDTSLVRPTSRTWSSAASALTPCGTSPVTTTTSASMSQPQAGSASGMGSRGPRNPSEPPWYISGSCQKLSGISAPRAFRTSTTWFT